jgi:hypothetical protein
VRCHGRRSECPDARRVRPRRRPLDAKMPPGRANPRRSPSDRARPVPHSPCAAMSARCRQPAMMSTPRVAARSPGEATLGGRAASTRRVPVCAPPAGTAGRVLVSPPHRERALTGTPRLSDTSAGRLSPAPAQLGADPVFQSDRCYRLPLTLPLNRPQTRWHAFARVARIRTVWPAHASTEGH